MTRKERIVMQRIMAREAIGKLRGILELFGAEDQPDMDTDDFLEFEKRVEDLELWIFTSSGIA